MTMLLGDCRLAECNDSTCLVCERVAIDAVFLPFIDLIASLTFTRREVVQSNTNSGIYFERSSNYHYWEQAHWAI